MTAPPAGGGPITAGSGRGGFVLAVETSTTAGSVAIVSPQGLRIEVTIGLEPSHGDRILANIDHALAEASLKIADLSGLAVSVGPGSFTGLRIGLATVKGLASAHPLPIVAVPTLEALAMNAPAGKTSVCPALDARKGEVYAALYTWRTEAQGWQVIVEEGAYAPDALAERLIAAGRSVVLIGDGALAYRGRLEASLGKRARFVEGPANQPRAAWVGWLGMRRLAAGQIEDPLTLVPRYLRPSEAELAWARRRGARGT